MSCLKCPKSRAKRRVKLGNFKVGLNLLFLLILLLQVRVQLFLKAPITTAADDVLIFFF